MMSDVEEVEVDVSDMENEMEEDVEDTSPRGRTPFVFEPLGMHVLAEIQKVQKQTSKAKYQVTQLDKDYRSRKDHIRSELYIGLTRFFKMYPDRHRVFLGDIPDEIYAAFLQPKKGLEKFKALDLKNKTQRVMRAVELDHGVDDRPFLYSTICSLNLIYTSKNSDKFEWTTHRLLDEDGGEAERMKQFPKKEFEGTIKSRITEELEKVEIEMQTPEKHTLFFVHKKTSADLVFIGIRKQVAPNPEAGATRKSKQRKKQGKGKEVKETSNTLTLVFVQGFPHFFVHGSIPEEEVVIKTLVESLGYQRSELQNLRGKNIRSLMEISRRKWTPPSLEAVEKEFRAEEAKETDRGVYYGSRMTEINRRYQVAAFRGAQRAGREEGQGTSQSVKKGGIEVITFTSSLGKSVTKFKGTAEEFDEYIIDAYEEGIITDLTPYINLKKTQSNQAHLGD